MVRHQKIDRSPEDQARIDALRERFQRERPSLDELVESGEFDAPIPQGEHWDLIEMLVALRSERERRGLSRDEVAARMGVEPDILRLLEMGKSEPTLSTLSKYAAAMGKQIVLSLTDLVGPSPMIQTSQQ